MRGDCSVRIDGIGFSSEEIAACASREGLLALEIDLVTENPCRCAACESTPGARREILSLEEIQGLIDQAKTLGARRCLLFDSDPQPHRHLVELIGYIIEKGMQLELFTTGAALSEATVQFLRQRNVTVILKCDSLADAGFHQTFARLTGLPLKVRIEVSDRNLAEIPAIWRWARLKAIEPYVQIITPRKSTGEDPKILASGLIRELFETLAKIDRVEFDRLWKSPPSLTGRSCKRHLFGCHVTPCGNIFACVGVTIPLGNVRTESLREILHLSEVLENLRDFQQNVKEPCRTCSQTTDCYGCRGAAYQITGDYLAGDSLCWKADNVPIDFLPAPVAELIPHGKSIRVIDRLVQIGERCLKSDYLVTRDSQLIDDSGRLDELAYIEIIAQSFAASHGFQLTAEQRREHRGLLLGVKDLAISGEAHVGDRLTVALRKVTRFGDFGVVEGDIRHQDGTLIAAAQLKIWRANENALLTATP